MIQLDLQFTEKPATPDPVPMPAGNWQIEQRRDGWYITGFRCGAVGPLRTRTLAEASVRMLTSFYRRHPR